MNSQLPTLRRPPHCVDHDDFDRQAFDRVSKRDSAVALMVERGRLLLPDLDALVADLFYAFYKGNVVLVSPDRVPPSGRIHHRVLSEIVDAVGFDATRLRTMLDENAAITAAFAVAQRVLELARRDHLLLEEEIFDAHTLKRNEEALADVESQRRALEALHKQHEQASWDQRPLDQNTVADLEDALDGEASGLEHAVRRGAERAQSAADDIPRNMTARIRGVVAELPRRLMELEADVESFGTAVGLGQKLDVKQRLALGEQLMRSDKLRKLAALVGAFRRLARIQRRRKVARRAMDLYDVGFGADPGRLLACELSALRHPVLRRDVRRRFVERRLLQYALEGPDDRGRGPMVVCLDGSGSMAGPKELWSKAVTLTLLETARRQRRPLRVIQFSAPPEPLFVRDLMARRPGADGHHPGDPQAIAELAEHFPGGGTHFQAPLEKALETLEQARFRRGDIVFITDGQCQIGASFLAELKAKQKRVGFRILGVLVDVGASIDETLGRFADDIERVSELTSDAAMRIVHKL